MSCFLKPNFIQVPEDIGIQDSPSVTFVKALYIIVLRGFAGLFQQSEAILEYDKYKVKLSQKFIEERLQNKNYPALTLWEFPIKSNNIDDFIGNSHKVKAG